MEQPTPRGWPAGLLNPSTDFAATTGFRSGHHVRLMRGSYVDAERWLACRPHERFHLMAAAKAVAAPEATFCGETALFLAGIGTFGTPSTVQLACGTRGSSGPDVVGYRTPTGHPSRGELLRCVPPAVKRHLHAAGFARRDVGGFGCVSAAEALAEVLNTDDLRRSLPAADTLAQWPDVLGVTADEVVALVRGRGRVMAARRVERAVALATGSSESVGESASRAVMLMNGFLPPLLQAEHWDGGVLVARSDFLWPSVGVIGEFDGLIKYDGSLGGQGARSAEQVFGQEKRREQQLMALGFRVVRWGWADLVEPWRLVRLLRSAGVPLA